MTTTITIEHKLGRYVVSYDGTDLAVHDSQDNQRVVLLETLDGSSLDNLTTAMTEAVKKYNQAFRGVQNAN